MKYAFTLFNISLREKNVISHNGRYLPEFSNCQILKKKKKKKQEGVHLIIGER